jgi:hypothetical protein
MNKPHIESRNRTGSLSLLQFASGSKLPFRIKPCAGLALLAVGGILAFRALFATGALPPDLTGTYMGDDGAVYYLQQSDNVLWWAGMSLDSGVSADLQWHRGLGFTNVFRGTVNEDYTVTGDWSDVTRGSSLNSGTLNLSVSYFNGHLRLTKTAATGGFGATTLTQSDPLDDTKVTGQTSDIYAKFDAIHKNGGETLKHDLKPYRDSSVFYAQLITSATDTHFSAEKGYYLVVTHEAPFVNYPTWGTSSRTYDAFAGENPDDDGSKDGDFDLRLKVDQDKLEPDFYVTGWENHDRATDIISWKLNSQLEHDALGLGGHFAYLHPEAIEYGVAFGLSLLPGWADLSSNSVLINGRPINGQLTGTNSANSPCNFVQPCPYTGPSGDHLQDGIQIGNQLLVAGSYIRITGALVLDCGHGIGQPCFDDPSNPTEVAAYQNQEIHPVYSIDIINPPFTPEDIGVFARANLTGTWGGDDGSTYYLRQIGNTVWFLGLLRDRQPNQQATSHDLIGARQVAAAGLLVGSPVCSSSMRCWMFGTVFKGTISQNSDGSSIIQGSWAGVPQSTSPGSTGSGVSFSVDKYHKVMTALSLQGLFPTKLEKMYEPEDTTPPQSTLSIGTPQFPTGASQPFVTFATSFSVTSTDSGSGVQTIWYRFFPSGSANPPPYTAVAGSSATFYLGGADGLYEVDTYASDAAGNDEASHSQIVDLDNTAPVASIAAPTATQYGHSDSFTISYAVSDGNGSGVKSATANIDGLTTLYDGTTPVTVANGVVIKLLTETTVGMHTFNVNSVDNLGNAGTNSVTFSVIVTPESIKGDVNQFLQNGKIKNGGLANSFFAKLNAAAEARARGDCKAAANNYQAFINELEAQNGKGVAAAAAAIMVSDARYLITHCP